MVAFTSCFLISFIMKLTIISVIISVLSLAECDACGPSEFSLRDGCKKCFCSGVSSKCRGSSFFKEKIMGYLDDIEGVLTIFNGSEKKVTRGFENQHQSFKGLNDFTFGWILPTNFYGNKLRSYSGDITLIEHIEAPSFDRDDAVVSVYLRSDKIELTSYFDAQILSGSRMLYYIPLEEGSWQVVTHDYTPATRDDVMKVLRNLKEIEVYAPNIPDMKTVSIEELSMDTAVDLEFGLDFSRTDSIEICECPEGYSGESCEKCSCGYYRDRYNLTETAFGACIHCPCHRDDKVCIMDNCVTDSLEISSDCDM